MGNFLGSESIIPSSIINEYVEQFKIYMKSEKDLIEMFESENVNEDLKSNNQLAWIQAMNNIKNRAEEIIYNENNLLAKSG